MDGDFYPSDEYECEGAPSAILELSDPRAVVFDLTMSTESKRALLASWASDMHAVENFPALRRLGDGTILCIDHILAALKALDAEEGPPMDRMSLYPTALTRPRIGSSDHFSSSGGVRGKTIVPRTSTCSDREA